MTSITVDKLKTLSDFFKTLNCKFKVKIVDQPIAEKWNCWFILPSLGYIELENIAPIKIDMIESLEINPIEEKLNGIRIQKQLIDHSAAVINFLNREQISYSTQNNIIKIN